MSSLRRKSVAALAGQLSQAPIDWLTHSANNWAKPTYRISRMTTFNPHIAADPAAQQAAAPAPAVVEYSEQYTMKRQQRLSLNQEEADSVNCQIDLIERCTGKRISVNKLIKQATLQKAEQVLEQGKNE